MKGSPSYGGKLEHRMCFLNSIQPTIIILYHFQALKKLISERKWWDGHLWYHDLRQQDDGQRWSQGRDYCHHPAHHMALSPHVFWSTCGEGKLFTICLRGWARRLTKINEGHHEVSNSFWLHGDHIFAAQYPQLHIHQL